MRKESHLLSATKIVPQLSPIWALSWLSDLALCLFFVDKCSRLLEVVLGRFEHRTFGFIWSDLFLFPPTQTIIRTQEDFLSTLSHLCRLSLPFFKISVGFNFCTNYLALVESRMWLSRIGAHAVFVAAWTVDWPSVKAALRCVLAWPFWVRLQADQLRLA